MFLPAHIGCLLSFAGLYVCASAPACLYPPPHTPEPSLAQRCLPASPGQHGCHFGFEGIVLVQLHLTVQAPKPTLGVAPAGQFGIMVKAGTSCLKAGVALRPQHLVCKVLFCRRPGRHLRTDLQVPAQTTVSAAPLAQ